MARSHKAQHAAGSIDAITPADIAALPASKVLSGAGSPLGVVTPSEVGVIYTDSSATLGARAWISTGTTKSAWRVLQAGTGYRSVGGLLENGWTASDASLCKATRQGDLVTLAFTNVNGSEATATTMLTLPTGWRPASIGVIVDARTALTVTATPLSAFVTWDGKVTCPTGAGSSTVALSVAFYTPDPWPTSALGS